MPDIDQSTLIARAGEDDAAGICRVHRGSLTVLCAGHYTPKEIEAWIGDRKTEDYLPGLRNNLVLVAKTRGRIAGFAELQVGDGLLRALYVHPRHARGGIGGTLLNCVENEARQAGLTEVHLNATLNSVSFFLNRGYTLLGEGTKTTRTGASIPCVRMRKSLGTAV